MTGIVRYKSSMSEEWNAFVEGSKNATFLFNRNYMDYHADRFEDHSLFFIEKEKIISVVAMNRLENSFISHQGLTYGGFLSGNGMKQEKMDRCFEALLNYAQQCGISEIVYKTIPYIYHRYPAGEDLHCLFKRGFRLTRRDVMATIDIAMLNDSIRDREQEVQRAKRNNLHVQRSRDLPRYMAIVKALTNKKFNRDPVHTAEEMMQLAAAFPDNIKLYAAFRNSHMLGGILIYETATVAHAQYIAADNEGEQTGAIDLVIDYLIYEAYPHKQYLDLGNCAENDGMQLNNGLMSFKERCGGRAVAHDFYTFKS